MPGGEHVPPPGIHLFRNSLDRSRQPCYPLETTI